MKVKLVLIVIVTTLRCINLMFTGILVGICTCTPTADKVTSLVTKTNLLRLLNTQSNKSLIIRYVGIIVTEILSEIKI